VQQHDALIGLARLSPGGAGPVEHPDAWQPLLGGIGTVDLGRAPAEVSGELEAVRVFAGYSGWGPRQLDDELEQDGWFVVDAHPDDLLTPDPASLWRVVLRRQGGDVAVSANYPRDAEPNAN
jgi:putative transcriptional regulator